MNRGVTEKRGATVVYWKFNDVQLTPGVEDLRLRACACAVQVPVDSVKYLHGLSTSGEITEISAPGYSTVPTEFGSATTPYGYIRKLLPTYLDPPGTARNVQHAKKPEPIGDSGFFS